MARDLAGGVGDVDDLREGAVRVLVRAAEGAVAEAEVERGADDDDEVGAGQRGAAGLGDERAVAAGDHAAAHPVGQGRDAEVLDEAQRGGLGVVGPDVGAEDQHGPPRRGEQPGDGLDRVGVGLDAGALARSDGAGRGVEEGVHRHVDEDRAAVARAGEGEGLVDAGGDVAGGHEGLRRLGDRRDDRRLVELLQRAGAPAVLRGAAADDDHRGAGELGLGDGADAVGDARAGGEDGEAGDAGELAGGLGGEGGGLLVAHVEQAHRRALALLLRLHRAVVHREDVGAGQGEHRLDAVGAGDVDGQLAAVAGDLAALLAHAAEVSGLLLAGTHL